MREIAREIHQVVADEVAEHYATLWGDLPQIKSQEHLSRWLRYMENLTDPVPDMESQRQRMVQLVARGFMVISMIDHCLVAIPGDVGCEDSLDMLVLRDYNASHRGTE